MIDVSAKTVIEAWLVLCLMAPYLLLGFLVAGLLSVCVSPARVERHLGHGGLGPVLKAALVGVPLPLCSCGVIPVSASLRRHGASRAATTSFLISTPQTGVDSIAVTWALLGPVVAILRPIAALVSGLFGGALVQWFDLPEADDPAAAPGPPKCADQCCQPVGSHNIVLRALRYGFVTLPRDIGAALLVGVLIAGALTALIRPGELQPYLGGGILSILAMMVVGVPIYVCATGSVPIAAGFIHLGASPGAAVAFLIAGPATNAATITMVWKLMGRRTAVLYTLTIAVSAVASGLAIDALGAVVNLAVPPLGAHVHSMAAGGWLGHLWAVMLLAVLANSFRVAWSRGPGKTSWTILLKPRREPPWLLCRIFPICRVNCR